MKRIIIAMVAATIVMAVTALGGNAAGIKVAAVKGDVSVRHGMNEQWTAVASGDVLKPDDSIRLGKHASATILPDAGRRLVIPEMVVLDLADVRMLTQEELLLQLAMERVRLAPARKHDDDFSIPRTTTVHGSDKGGSAVRTAALPEDGPLQLNGVKVLYQNGYYGTSVLRAKEIYRLIPTLAANVDSRLLVASALEKMGVPSEALNEYHEIGKGNLTAAQRALVDQRVAALQRQAR